MLDKAVSTQAKSAVCGQQRKISIPIKLNIYRTYSIHVQ